MQITKKRQKISVLMATIITFVFAIMPSFAVNASATSTSITGEKSVITVSLTDEEGDAVSLVNEEGSTNKLVAGSVYSLEILATSAVTKTNLKIEVSGVDGVKMSSAQTSIDNALSATLVAGSETFPSTTISTTATKYFGFSFEQHIAESKAKDVTITVTNIATSAVVDTIVIPKVYTFGAEAVATTETSILNADGSAVAAGTTFVRNQIYYAKVGYYGYSKAISLALTASAGTAKFGSSIALASFPPAATPAAAGASGSVKIGANTPGIVYVPFKFTADVTTATAIEFKLGTTVAATVTGAKVSSLDAAITLKDVAYAGAKKASTLAVLHTKADSTAKAENLTAYHISGETRYAVASKLTLVDNEVLLIKGVKFNMLPILGDKIVLENESYSFTITLDANYASKFTAAPTLPIVTVKNGSITLKGEAGATITLTDNDASPKTKVVTLDNKGAGTASTSDLSAFSTYADGYCYAYLENTASYGTAKSILVPVYFPKGTQSAAAVATVTGVNKVTLKSKTIGGVITAYVDGSTTGVVVTGNSGTGSVEIDVSKIAAITDAVHRVQFTVTEGGKSVSPLSNAVYVSVNSNAANYEVSAPVLGNSSGNNKNIIINNNLGSADTIVVGAFTNSKPTKVLVFAVPASDASNSDAIAKALATTSFDASGKVINLETKKGTVVSPYYTGLNGSGAANKEITIKGDLSAYVGYNLIFYVVNPTTGTDDYGKFMGVTSGVPAKHAVPAEKAVSNWHLTIHANVYTGDADAMTVVVTGVEKGDAVTIYNSVTGLAKTVKAADTIVVFSGIKMSQGYDQISVVRPNMETLTRKTLATGDIKWNAPVV